MQTKKGILISTLLVLTLAFCLLFGVSLTAIAGIDDNIYNYDTNDLNKMRAFAQQGNNNDLAKGLGWNLSEPWTWNYIEWTRIDGKWRLQKFNVHNKRLDLSGSLDLSYCTALTYLDFDDTWLDGLELSSLNLSGCTALKSLKCNGNMLTELKLDNINKLELLSCNFNKLAILPVLPTTLAELYCNNNQLTQLPALPTSLEYLDCGNNHLTKLPGLSLSLKHLYCYYNHLTQLPELPATLIELLCGENEITQLPELPAGLKLLSCYNNQLTQLPGLPLTLEELYCSSNQLKQLPALPTTLIHLTCYINQLEQIPTLPISLKTLYCHLNRLAGLNVSGLSLDHFDCSYNYIADKNDVIGFTGTWDIENYDFSPQHNSGFIAATGIINLPTTAKVGIPLTLSGTVVPSDATNREINKWQLTIIEWQIADNNGIAANIDGNTFKATAPGTAHLIAYVKNGYSDNEDMQFDFRINVTPDDPPDSNLQIEGIQHNLPFTDVSKSNWFYDNVVYVYENGLMIGTSDDKFSPNLTLTRGMVVTVLYRLAGEPGTIGLDNPFTDIGNTWYTNAIKWAAENGIVTGYGDGKFGPNDKITREQMAAILYRYMVFAKINPQVPEQLINFADEAQISDYAMDAIQTLFKLGIIQGVGENTINPKGDATRAQFAAMIHRMQELVK